MTAPSRRSVLQAFSLAPLVLPLAGHAGMSASAAPALAANPGPAGDLAWSGYNWKRRTWSGAPQFNGRWSADNVVVNGDGTLTLRLTNGGSSPVGAELMSTRAGWGYGTYRLDFRADFDTMSPSVVWGNLFTYDSTQPAGSSANEIDAGEISAWGVPSTTPRLSAGYWTAGPKKVQTHDKALPRGLRVFRSTMTWRPGSVSFATYGGTTTASTLVASSSRKSSTVPVPAQEKVHVSLWVTAANADDESRAKPLDVRLTRFAFTPA